MKNNNCNIGTVANAEYKIPITRIANENCALCKGRMWPVETCAYAAPKELCER